MTVDVSKVAVGPRHELGVGVMNSRLLDSPCVLRPSALLNHLRSTAAQVRSLPRPKTAMSSRTRQVASSTARVTHRDVECRKLDSRLADWLDG